MTPALHNARVKPLILPITAGPPPRTVTAILLVTSTISIFIPVGVALTFSPIWWISVPMTALLAMSGLALTRVPEQRFVGHLLLVAASTVNLIDFVFWGQPNNYLGEVGFLSQWWALPPMALAFVLYPGSEPDESTNRFYLGAWLWATIPRIVAALSVTSMPNIGWWGLVDLPAVHNGALVTEAVLSFALASWATVLFVRRWRAARGTAAVLTRLMAAFGTVVAWGVPVRETGMVLFMTERIRRDQWDRLGDVHQIIIVITICTLGVTVWRSFARRGPLIDHLLATAGDPIGLQRVLRDELSDPSVELYFLVDDAWYTAEGIRRDPPTGSDRDVVQLAVQHGRPAVMASLDPQDRLDAVRRRLALATSGVVLNAASLAIERDAYVAEIAASRTRIATEAEAQRRQLERMLHDGIQQSLLATTATLSRAKLASRAGDTGTVGESIGQAHTQLLSTLAELRRLARGLYPSALVEAGLLGGVRSLTERWDEAELTIAGPEEAYEDLSRERGSLLYFAIAEGLANAHKYGRGPVTVDLSQDEATVTGAITDAGPGGAVIVPEGGLAGLGDRVLGLGGSLTLLSPPGGPTSLTVTIPRH